MAELLNHLLAHSIPTNDLVVPALPNLLAVLRNDRAVPACEAEEGLNGPVMHRWNLRLVSLIQPTAPSTTRAAGFRLLHSTFTTSTSSLLSQSKAVLALALNVLGAPKPAPTLFVDALELVKLVLALSTWHAEWAREVVGASTVQRVVQSLVKAANGEAPELLVPSVDAIVALIPLFPTPLRPLSPSLHTLAISLICDPICASSNVGAGACLFVSLYLLSPKGKDGLREAWKKGVEALVGSIDSLVPLITSDIYAEDPLTNHTLSPLALPPLSSQTPLSALSRLESLVQVLALILRTPTSERTGAVEIPTGAMVELGARLVGMNTEMPVKERTDPTTLTFTRSLLPRLQISGCLLLAQLGMCAMRPTLSTTYSLVVEALGGSIDPEEAKRSLARVWRTLLEDIGAVAVEPVTAPSSEDKGRKAKRQKTYDPSESMDLAGRRVHLNELDLQIAERAFSTLERLLAAPYSHFLPPKLRISTSRLLLALALDPTFFISHPSISTSSTFFPAVAASRGVDIAKQSEGFRRGVLRCLKASLEGGKGSDGLVDRAIEVWRLGCTDTDPEVKCLSVAALGTFSALIHPALPPLQVNTTFARLKQERLGDPIGDDQAIVDGAQEFAPKEAEIDEAPEQATTMEVDAAAVGDDKVAAQIQPPVVTKPVFPSSNGFSVDAFSSSTGSSFSTIPKPFSGPAAPSPAATITTTATATASPPAPALDKPTFVAIQGGEAIPFSSTPLPSVPRITAVAKPTTQDVGDEDSSDDEVMPTIVMDSDEEE